MSTEDVRAANLEMYRAFESLRIERMEAAWAHDGQVTCVHPGWPLVIGWEAVRRSWDTIFRHTETIAFEISDELIEIRGELAWVVCFEKISSGDSSALVIATNVLRRDEGRWRMVHHHAAAAPVARAAAQPPPPPPSTPKKVVN